MAIEEEEEEEEEEDEMEDEEEDMTSCKGDQPRLSCALQSAPRARRRRTTSTWRWRHAWWRAVSPYCGKCGVEEIRRGLRSDGELHPRRIRDEGHDSLTLPRAFTSTPYFSSSRTRSRSPDMLALRSFPSLSALLCESIEDGERRVAGAREGDMRTVRSAPELEPTVFMVAVRGIPCSKGYAGERRQCVEWGGRAGGGEEGEGGGRERRQCDGCALAYSS
jgi:hypothetical protein